MIEKTNALVLRIAHFSETSDIVSWLTDETGIITTVIKGAHRPKSAFLGQYDLFYTCELLYYSRHRNGLHIARECSPISSRPRLRTNWRASFSASYATDLAARTSVRGISHHSLFELLYTTLDFLTICVSAPVVFWYELTLLSILGLAPQLTNCAICTAQLPSKTLTFSPALGGLLCPNCQNRRSGESTRIGPDVAALLRTWQANTSPRAAANIKCTPAQLSAVRMTLGMFLNFHLEIPTISSARGIVMKALSHDHLTI